MSDELEKQVSGVLGDDPGASDLFAVSADAPSMRDVCPSETATIIAAPDGERLHAIQMQWGFPGPSGKGLLINARAETAREKQTFRESILRRRCVIPAAGFYEWDHDRNRVSFFRKDHSLLWFAGFYDLFDNLQHFVILTTAANASVKPVHDRMPCILNAGQLHDWICRDDLTEDFLRMEMPMLERYQEYAQLSLQLDGV